MSQEPLLKIRGLTRAFGASLAVDGVDLDLEAGEILGLVGKNGAGKSTMIRMVTGDIARDGGTIAYNGSIVDFRGPAAAHRAGVAVVHQELSIVVGLSVAEFLRLGSGYPHTPLGLVSWRSLREQARRSLDAVGLTHVAPTTRVEQLSPVEQRLLMIAAALVHEAKVLILDEPTASFAEREVQLLHEVMRRLSAQGTGIIFVSHRLDEVLTLTDRVVVMRDGRVVAVSVTSAVDKPALIELITGERAPEEVSTRVGDVMAHDEVLRVTDLATTDGGATVSFSVHAGEILGIGGLVGSGRTEVLRAMYGADPRVTGEVRVSGALVPASPRRALTAGMVLLTEDRRDQGLIRQFSVRRNLTIAALKGLRRRSWMPFPSPRRERTESRALVHDLAIKVSADDAAVMSLSGGNQQKVLLGRWLAVKPRVLLLDEPTIGVDVGAKADIQDRILDLAAQGMAVVVVASEFSQLEEMCHRVIVMSRGAVVSELHGSAITERAILDACFDASEAEAEADEAAATV